MFTLQPGDEVVFGTPTTPHGYQIPDDLIANQSFMESNIISFGSSSNDRQLQRIKKSGFPQRQTESRNGCDVRKAMRRDIERKRRQEMSNLYISLNSHLPLDHNKGKRSVNDQMLEAVNYIKQMQKNIQELRFRRDKLKELSNSSGTNFENSNGSHNLRDSVSVNLVQDGLEILISSSSDSGISRILAELIQRELNVVSCVSTRAEGGFLHKIRVEGRDTTSLDVSVLQNGLTKSISSNMG